MDTVEKTLEVRNLSTTFTQDDQRLPAVRDVTFEIARGQTLGLVGESGCGKTVTALSILRLLGPAGEAKADRMRFRGRDLLGLTENEMTEIRGRGISMIFQDPTASLNPVLQCGDQLRETVLRHLKITPDRAIGQSLDLLDRVGIVNPRRVFESYPHELSGGMQQRVMIALALAGEPDLLIADEPTTALDVTVQSQILRLIRDLQSSREMSMMIISHDLGVIAETADQVAVMYAGRIVETAPVDRVLKRPLHPYSIGLSQSVPRLDRVRKLHAIEGSVPYPTELPSGCSFRDRCSIAQPQCGDFEPSLEEMEPDHYVRCRRAKEILGGLRVSTAAGAGQGNGKQNHVEG